MDSGSKWNTTLKEGEIAWRIIGRSQILSVFGEVLAEASSEREEIIHARIDVRAATHNKQLLPGVEWKKSDLFWARRPETYDIILSK